MSATAVLAVPRRPSGGAGMTGMTGWALRAEQTVQTDNDWAVLEWDPAGVAEATTPAQEPLARAGVPMTRAAPARGLRERGVRIGTARAGRLLALLRTGHAAARLPGVATGPGVGGRVS